MWMLDYIGVVQRELVKTYPDKITDLVESGGRLSFSIPDGIYPVTIEGKIDNVELKSGRIFCCNYQKETHNGS